MNLTCVLSNRCTYGRQKILLEKIKADPDINLTLLLTGGILNDRHLYSEISSAYTIRDLYMSVGADTLNGMAQTCSELTREAFLYFTNNICDCCIIIADRHELLPVATVVAYLDIPIAHIQGFEVSGNIDNKVRDAISMLADIHFVSHTWAKIRGHNMGRREVYDVGCPSIDFMKSLGL